MMQPLSSLKTGETYGNYKYKIWKVDCDSITIIRQSDKWIIVFTKNDPSFNRMVKKD